MNRTKSTRWNALIMVGSLALLALTGLGLSGCLIIPTPSHGGVGVIPEETIESFEPGTTTRADVLLRLGDPTKRLEEDRFFVYEWERVHWYVVGDFGKPPRVDARPLNIPHYLGLEFMPDGRVKRVKTLDSWFGSSNHYSKLEEWMAEEHELPHP